MSQLKWNVSQFCAIAGCIEVAQDGDTVLLRLTQDPGTELRASSAEWVAFVAGVKSGQFDFVFPTSSKVAAD